MRNPRAFGGTGNVRARPLVRAGETLYAGEAAGLQDALWGFGMRCALVSGHMAGEALLAERPAQYDRSFRQRFTGFLRTSVVNRYFYERMGDRGYARLLHAIARAHDAREWLRRFYAPRLWKTLWFPVARIAVEAARPRPPIPPPPPPPPPRDRPPRRARARAALTRRGIIGGRCRSLTSSTISRPAKRSATW